MPVYQANILVDKTCRARLADFGLLTILSDSTTSSSYSHGGTTRWMSPELFKPEIKNHCRTKHSDCYALGMVIYEVLAQREPFFQYQTAAIFWKVGVEGERPRRPEGVKGAWFTDDLWEMLERCWVPQPERRPSIEDVLHCLEKISMSWIPPSPRLLAASLAAGLHTEGSSHQYSTTDIATIGVNFPPRTAMPGSPEGLDIGKAVSMMRRSSFLLKFWYLLGVPSGPILSPRPGPAFSCKEPVAQAESPESGHYWA